MLPTYPVDVTHTSKPGPTPQCHRLFAAGLPELVDWPGRAIREGKRGAIDGNAPILERLNLNPYRFVEHLSGKTSTESPTMLGKAEKLK